MINLHGFAHRSFLFPADLNSAYAYYSDLTRVFSHLPHISLVTAHADDHFRMVYSATELGAYTIRIYCDMRATLDGGQHMIRIVPEEGPPPIEPRASLNSTTGRGYFSFQSLFNAAGEQTEIEFKLQMQARLPRPGAMRIMLGGVVNRLAHSFTERRMNEIIEGFITQSIQAFPEWEAERIS